MMLKTFAEYPPRKRVGLLAILLGIFAAFIGDPTGGVTKRVNLKELSMIAATDNDKVHVKDLAEWIIEGKFDYRLVDLRKPEEFEKYNIPSSECIPASQLLNSDLMRNEKIVLYADDEFTAAQGWFVLKANDYKGVYVLEGGLQYWKDQILFPKLRIDASPEEKIEFQKMAEISKFFGGQPQTGTTVSKQNTEMPKLKAPVKVKLKKSRGKRKREGC